MDALVIAPEVEGKPELETWKEVDRIGDLANVRAEVLVGPNVTKERVTARLGQQYDVVVFAGHGEPGFFLVSDGKLEALWLARQLQKSPPGIVLLAACDSAGRSQLTLNSLAEAIHTAGISVVAMLAPIADASAVVYDIEFVRAYADGASVTEAHAIAMRQMAMDYGAQCTIPLLMHSNGRRVTTNSSYTEALVQIQDSVEGVRTGVGRVDRRTEQMKMLLDGHEQRLASIEGFLWAQDAVRFRDGG